MMCHQYLVFPYLQLVIIREAKRGLIRERQVVVREIHCQATQNTVLYCIFVLVIVT